MVATKTAALKRKKALAYPHEDRLAARKPEVSDRPLRLPPYTVEKLPIWARSWDGFDTRDARDLLADWLDRSPASDDGDLRERAKAYLKRTG